VQKYTFLWIDINNLTV